MTDRFFCYKRKHKEFIRNNILILKRQQIFKSAKQNVFTKEINKIAWSSNDDQRMKSIDSIETYAYETRKYHLIKTEEIKCNNIIKRIQEWLTLMILHNKTWNNIPKLATNSWSSMQSINNWRIWIWKNVVIIKYNKSSTRYW